MAERAPSYSPTGFAEKIFKQRYAISKDETWEEACERIASYVSACEVNGNRQKWSDRYTNKIQNNKFIPAGRIWYGAGRAKGQLLNCFTIPTEDSREGWGQTVKDMLIISGTGGGVGMNLSPIRPRGTAINGTGGEATGAVSLMEVINQTGEVIKAGGGRRTALMLCLDYDHFDVIEFLNKKFNKVDIDSGDIEGVKSSLIDAFPYIPADDVSAMTDILTDNGAAFTDDAVEKIIRPLIKHQKDQILKNANISVTVDQKFFDLIEEDGDIIFSWRGQEIDKMKAREMWDILVYNAWESGEPGILNKGYANEMNNIYYHKKLNSTNPCVSGDTLIAVADGRGAIPIRDLVSEGKDVPVYTLTEEGKITIEQMRNPRITGVKNVYRMVLDDGSYIDATDNHKFLLKSGEYKPLSDLVPGDSLEVMKREIKPIINKKSVNSSKYVHVSVGGKYQYPATEHRLIAQHAENIKNGGFIKRGYVVHHKDYDSLNNHIDNLEVMTKEAHDELHRETKLGQKNPFHTTFTDTQRENFIQAASKPGTSNGRYSGFTNEEIYAESLKLTTLLGRQATKEEWMEYAKKRGLPMTFSSFRSNYFGSILEMLNDAANECSVPALQGTTLREYKKYLNYLENFTDLDIIWKNDTVRVNKQCEHCSETFEVAYGRREQSYCSVTCRGLGYSENASINKLTNSMDSQLKAYTDLKFELGREPFKEEYVARCLDDKISCGLPAYDETIIGTESFGNYKELKKAAVSYNHRIISIELLGEQPVYNGTVDNTHNFFCTGTISDLGEDTYFLNSKNCGEIWLEDHGCCDLGSINLSNHLNKEGTDIDWDVLADTVTVGVRFLDSVLSVNHYPLPAIEKNSKEVRRIGLGVMGLGHTLVKLGLRYDRTEGRKMVDRIFNFMKKRAYEASTYLAAEKGPFPAFNAEKFLESGFCKTLPKYIRAKIKEYGIRNCALLTIAPTGTTSILAATSSGIEPIFAPGYERKYYAAADGSNERLLQQEIVIDPLFEELQKEGYDMSAFVSAHEVSVENHLKIQSICQKHICNAVSKTVNLPNDYPVEKFGELLLKYAPTLKGTTVYRSGSRGNEPLTPLSVEEAVKYVNLKNKENLSIGTINSDCPSGVCDLSPFPEQIEQIES